MFYSCYRVNRALCANCRACYEVVPKQKNALLLDYGGNVLRHGCIDDVTVKAKGEGTGEAPAKECPSCETILHAAVRECPECGYIFEREPEKTRVKRL